MFHLSQLKTELKERGENTLLFVGLLGYLWYHMVVDNMGIKGSVYEEAVTPPHGMRIAAIIASPLVWALSLIALALTIISLPFQAIEFGVRYLVARYKDWKEETRKQEASKKTDANPSSTNFVNPSLSNITKAPGTDPIIDVKDQSATSYPNRRPITGASDSANSDKSLGVHSALSPTN